MIFFTLKNIVSVSAYKVFSQNKNGKYIVSRFVPSRSVHAFRIGLHQDMVSPMAYCLWFNSWNGFQWRVKRLNSQCSWNALMFAAPVQICTPVHVKENRCMLLCYVVICEGNTIKWRFLIFVIYIIKIICPLELSWVFAACASSTAQCSDFATAGDRGTAVHRAATHNGD